MWVGGNPQYAHLSPTYTSSRHPFVARMLLVDDSLDTCWTKKAKDVFWSPSSGI